jgi:hypothetical protein
VGAAVAPEDEGAFAGDRGFAAAFDRDQSTGAEEAGVALREPERHRRRFGFCGRRRAGDEEKCEEGNREQQQTLHAHECQQQMF